MMNFIIKYNLWSSHKCNICSMRLSMPTFTWSHFSHMLNVENMRMNQEKMAKKIVGQSQTGKICATFWFLHNKSSLTHCHTVTNRSHYATLFSTVLPLVIHAFPTFVAFFANNPQKSQLQLERYTFQIEDTCLN